MLQNLLCLWKKKTHVVFFVYVDIDQGIHKGKMKVALIEKRKKLHGFSFSIIIANFEAFLQRIKLTKKRLFLKSVKSTRSIPDILYFQNGQHKICLSINLNMNSSTIPQNEIVGTHYIQHFYIGKYAISKKKGE